MTNYEWLTKNNEELVKHILAQHVSKEKGIPNRCSRTGCDNCDFGGYPCSLSSCTDATKEWLEAEHEPLYKKGDIIIDSDNRLRVVKEDTCDGFVTLSIYVDESGKQEVFYETKIEDIKKKVGHIENAKG